MLICNAIFAFCHQGDAINIKRGNQEQQIGRNGKNNFDRLVIKIKQINFLYWQNVHIWCLIKDSFLYNRIMKDLRHSSPTVLRKSVLAYCKAEFAFFSIWVFFHEYSQFTEQQLKGDAISISFLPLRH